MIYETTRLNLSTFIISNASAKPIAPSSTITNASLTTITTATQTIKGATQRTIALLPFNINPAAKATKRLPTAPNPAII